MSMNVYIYSLRMTQLKAYKMHGLGNRFLIIDRRKNFVELSKNQIKSLAENKLFNFDQLIYLDKEKNSTYPITIVNADGIEVSACGNGSRCIAYFLAKEKKQNKIQLNTIERNLVAEVYDIHNVKIDMGKPKFSWKEIPLAKDLDHKKIPIILKDNDGNSYEHGFALNVGNPHLIYFVKNCENFDLKKIGPEIENHKLFPERCNLTLAQVVDHENVKISVWERGAGLTEACGTAACATAVAGVEQALIKNKSNIIFKSGKLILEIDQNKNISMTGPVSDIQDVMVNL